MIDGVFGALGPQGWGTYQVSGQDFVLTDQKPEGFLIPGFVDLHIHGAFGIDVMSASSDDLIQLAESLRREGYAGFLATTVTAPASAVAEVQRKLPDHPAILGLHIEGPFISTEYPGAQPPASIQTIEGRDPQWDEILRDPRVRQITLAPELPSARSWIADLATRMNVSAGHTNATFEQFAAAVDQGLNMATHTFNAMRGFHHREVGSVGAALLLDSVTTELIYDRTHVGREAAELLIRAKPVDKIVAVSDCTMAKGTPEGAPFEMWGHQVEVRAGQVQLIESGALAGSCATLYDVFRKLAEDFGIDVAVQLCCLNPRRQISQVSIPEVLLILDERFIIQRIVTDL